MIQLGQEPVVGNLHEKHDHYKYLFNETPYSKTYYQKSLNQAINAVIDHLENRPTPFSGVAVETLKTRFAQAFIDDSSLGDSLHLVLEELKSLYLDDAISFHQNKYVAHLNCPILVPTLAAEVIISALNTSMDTWDQSAGATLIETKLIDWTLDKIGYPQNGDGIFTSGGTQSNLMGLLLARDYFIANQLNWNSKLGGLPPESAKFKIFSSEVAHFSLKKNASILGLGQKCIVPVAVDDHYKMDLIALEAAILRERALGNVPIAVVGTAGTTDFSSIDPLYQIAQVAKKYQLWFHVDAAYGGGLVLSDHHHHKLSGIELSDSATIDYHKTFFQPVSSSAFFMRDENHVDFIKYHADYLNPKEQEDDGVPNLVKKSIQTTRRFDALKLWLTLRVVGKKRLGMYIDTVVTLAKDTAELLRQHRNFEVLNDPEFSAIVFRYRPEEDIGGVNLSDLNTYIRRSMFRQGRAVVAGTKVQGEFYLKFTLLNPTTTLQDMQDILHIIEEHGAACLQRYASATVQLV